jgi:hypothetical protein
MATKDKKQGGLVPAQDQGDPAQDQGAQADSDPPQEDAPSTPEHEPTLTVLAAPEGLLTVSHEGQTYEVRDGLVAVLPEHVNYLISFMECRRP